MLLVMILAIVLLLLLNAFFAFAEFAAVRARPAWVENLEAQKHPKAKLVRHLHRHIDEYLSVVQVGITLTSIALGFVGEPTMAALLAPVLAGVGIEHEAVAHGLAISIGYILISFLHIVVGELVPKGMAIRFGERAALLTAAPMRFFYYAFYLPRVVLHRSARLLLRFLGIRDAGFHEQLSEDELRVLLGQSQARGVVSLRRLLMLENIFDLGQLHVRDAMRGRAQAAHITPQTTLEEFLRLFRERHYSRYPLLLPDDRVDRLVNIKDVLDRMAAGAPPALPAALARPCIQVRDDAPLERLLADLQRHRQQMAIVTGADGRWVGIVTMEDILEEIVGTLGDEFEVQKPAFLADLVTPDRILLDIKGETIPEAIREIAANAALKSVAIPELLQESLLKRENTLTTYIGKGIAIPHARLADLPRSTVIFARSRSGLETGVSDERAHLVFIVLTPTSAPGEHARIVARIAALTDSDYILGRLVEASTSQAVIDILREGDPSVNPE